MDPSSFCLLVNHRSNMDHTKQTKGTAIYKCILILDGGVAPPEKTLASQIETCLQGSGEKYNTNPCYIPLYSLVHRDPYNGLV